MVFVSHFFGGANGRLACTHGTSSADAITLGMVLLGYLYSEPCLTLSATICLYVARFPWVCLKYRRFIKDHQHDADEGRV